MSDEAQEKMAKRLKMGGRSDKMPDWIGKGSPVTVRPKLGCSLDEKGWCGRSISCPVHPRLQGAFSSRSVGWLLSTARLGQSRRGRAVGLAGVERHEKFLESSDQLLMSWPGFYFLHELVNMTGCH